MSDRDPPTTDPRDVLEKDRTRKDDRRDWLSKRLLGYCFRRTGDLQRAKDAAQDAILLVLEAKGWHAWRLDPEKTPEQSLLDHLSDVVKSTVKDHNARASTRRETAVDPERDDEAVDPEPLADQQLQEHEARERAMRRAERVMARLDDRARGMVELEQEGIHDAETQAERLKCTVKEIHRARERVAYHRDAVLDEDPDSTRGGQS